MPSADQHRSKAERNQRFLATIALGDFPEWVVVVAFYTAVHLIERLRAAAGHGHSPSHEDRLEYVQNHLPAEVHSDYHVLQNVSMLARYHSMSEFFAQFQPADVEEHLVKTRLARIAAYVETELSA